MLCREIFAVFPQIHTKHINTLCGQTSEYLNVKLVVHTVTTAFTTLALVYLLPKDISDEWPRLTDQTIVSLFQSLSFFCDVIFHNTLFAHTVHQFKYT